MIKIVFKRSSDGFVSFTVKGHSGYSEFGSDIVCSAVSCLAQAAIIGTTEVLKFKPFFKAESADIELDLHNLRQSQIENCQVLMKTAYLCLKNLELSYGKYIKVKVEEV